jgi:hypothetical protein
MEVVKKNVVVHTAPTTDANINVITWAGATRTDALKVAATAEGSESISVTSDTAYTNIVLYVPVSLAKQAWDIEFDIEIRVNDVRYV